MCGEKSSGGEKCVGRKECGEKSSGGERFRGRKVCGEKSVWGERFLGRKVPGEKRVLGRKVPGGERCVSLFISHLVFRVKPILTLEDFDDSTLFDDFCNFDKFYFSNMFVKSITRG